jgi:hypothetical protein
MLDSSTVKNTTMDEDALLQHHGNLECANPYYVSQLVILYVKLCVKSCAVLCNLPSVSVALSSILKNFVFQDELLTSSPFITGFVRPVPNETTHWIGKPGHNCLASCSATAVGLFTKRPPS